MNTENYREKEIKLLVTTKDMSYDRVRSLLMEYPLHRRQVITSKSVTSTDYYYIINNTTADFLRIRASGENGKVEATIKHKDKGNNLNRLEINTSFYNNLDDVLCFYKHLFSKPFDKELTKTYDVVIGNDVVFCSCIIIGTSNIYIEVESGNEKDVLREMTKLCKYLSDNGISTVREERSFYEIYIDTNGNVSS
jgi:hypothetical protein